jgi:ubiquinol oxidase
MITSRTVTRVPIASGRVASQLLKTAHTSARPTFVAVQHVHSAPSNQRYFSSTEKPQDRKFFEKATTEKVRKTPAAWPHPVYNEEQMNAVVVAHREATTTSDRLALAAVKVLRSGLDFATGYRHERAVDLNAKDPEAARKKYAMTEEKYMIRNVFLESVAGVPGMVAGMIRHLNSMRRMKRDNGWYVVKFTLSQHMLTLHLQD